MDFTPFTERGLWLSQRFLPPVTMDPFTAVTLKGYEIAKDNVKNYDYHKCFWRNENQY